MKKRAFQKVISIFASFLLLINSFSPFLLITPAFSQVKAQTETATPTVEETLTPTPTGEPTPTNTPIPVPPQSPNRWTFEKVELNKEYVAPQNNEVKLTFTKLPSPSGNIKIEEITLTDDQIKKTGSLSNKAYDITSDMKDGDFSYNLSLPIPESSKGKPVEVKFAEELSNIDAAKKVDNSITKTDTTVSVASLDHMTIFVVSGTIVEDEFGNLSAAYVPDTGNVVINEFVFDPSSGNEWVELYNTSSSPSDDLGGWTIKDRDDTNTDITITSGTVIPANGILVFENNSSGWLDNVGVNTNGDTITLRNSGDTIMSQVTYQQRPDGTIFINGQASTTTYSGQGQSIGRVINESGITWQAYSTPSKGWFNDAGEAGKAPTLSSIDSTLASAGIDSNIGELNNPSATPNTEAGGALYFEKSGYGKIVFEKTLNLSDQDTVSVLQTLGTAMSISNGHMKFDSDTADKMKATGAKIYMYGLNYSSTPDIFIKNDAGETLGTNDPSSVSGINYDPDLGELSFTALHFTQFDLSDAPTLTVVTPVTTPTNNHYPSYIFNSSEAGTITYGGGCNSLTTDAIAGDNSITFDYLESGEYNCTINVVDLTGNTSETLNVNSFTIDSSGPDVSNLDITPINEYNYVKGIVTVSANVTDTSGISSVNFRLYDYWGDYEDESSCINQAVQDANDPTLWSCQLNTSSLSVDPYYDLQVTAEDSLKNTSYSSYIDDFSKGDIYVDNLAPTTTDSGIDSDWHNSDVTVNLSCSDDTSCMNTYYTTDGSDPTTFSSSGNEIVLTEDGQYTIKYFSEDYAGNQEAIKTAANTVNIDKIVSNPDTPETIPNPTNSTSQTWSWPSVSDSLSGIAQYIWRVGGFGGSTSDTSVVTNLLEGIWNFFVKVQDKAGNESEETSSDSLNVDTTAPTVTKLGDGSSDFILNTGDTDLNFSEILSDSAKTAVENALTAGADKTLIYNWNDNTLTITATETTSFANDVIVNIEDPAGNKANSLLLVDSKLSDTQISPDSEGDVTADSETPEVVVTDPDQEVTVNVDGTTEATINVSSFITEGEGEIPKININSDDAEIDIPATKVTGPTGWDGVIAAPTVTTVDLPVVSGETSTLGTAIEVGFSSDKLSFDNAVRILLPGQAGKRAGYSRPGLAFTEITNSCSADSQAAGDALEVDGECKIDVGDDLIIWTKHFTKFAAYTQTTNSTSTSSSSSTSSSGGTSNPSAPVCNDQKPGSAPVLLSVSSGLNSVTLTWAKANDPVSYYLVTFGTKSGEQLYGNPNVGGSETTSYTINNLSGGKTYYFKVRAGNGCMPGDYSNEKSGSPSGGFIAGIPGGFAPGVLGAQTQITPTSARSGQTSPGLPRKQNPTGNVQHLNFFQRIWNFILGLFRR